MCGRAVEHYAAMGPWPTHEVAFSTPSPIGSRSDRAAWWQHRRWGNGPLALTARLSFEFNASIEFVTGMKILGADIRLRFPGSRRMVRPSGTEAPGARRCGQADPHDEPRARVSSWPPLRLARLRRERESV